MRRKLRSTVLSILPPLPQIHSLFSVLTATLGPQTYSSGSRTLERTLNWSPSCHTALPIPLSVWGRDSSMWCERAPPVGSGGTTTHQLCDFLTHLSRYPEAILNESITTESLVPGLRLGLVSERYTDQKLQGREEMRVIYLFLGSFLDGRKMAVPPWKATAFPEWVAESFSLLFLQCGSSKDSPLLLARRGFMSWTLPTISEITPSLNSPQSAHLSFPPFPSRIPVTMTAPDSQGICAN